MKKLILSLVIFTVLALAVPIYKIQTDQIHCVCAEGFECTCPDQPFAYRPLPMALSSIKEYDNLKNWAHFEDGVVRSITVSLLGVLAVWVIVTKRRNH